MSISKAPAAGQAPKNTQRRSSYQRAVTAMGTFLLATTFALAGAPAATASTNNHMALHPMSTPGGDGGDGGGRHYFCGGAPGSCAPRRCYPDTCGWSDGAGRDRVASESTVVPRSVPASSGSLAGPLCGNAPGVCPTPDPS